MCTRAFYEYYFWTHSHTHTLFNTVQVGYQIVIKEEGGAPVWDSGKVNSNESTYVAYTGPKLAQGTPYEWTVTTWSASASGGTPCQSAPSAPAQFVTALYDGWDNNTKFIQLGAGVKATFAYFRKEVTTPAGIISAQAFITAPVDVPLLSGCVMVMSLFLFVAQLGLWHLLATLRECQGWRRV